MGIVVMVSLDVAIYIYMMNYRAIRVHVSTYIGHVCSIINVIALEKYTIWGDDYDDHSDKDVTAGKAE